MKLKPNTSKLYHSKKWRDFRQHFLRDNYKCYACETTINLELDHILEHRENEKLFYNKKNIQTLCKPCHFVKTMKDKKILSFETTPEKTFYIKIDLDKKLDITLMEIFYTWKRDEELVKNIVLKTIADTPPAFNVYELGIKDLEFWKVKKILDGFAFHFKQIPLIILDGEIIFSINDFLINLLEI